MHFPIIEIVSDKNELGKFGIYEDVTLEYFTDYYGDEYSEEERIETIEQLKEFFDGLATVNVENGTVTVNSSGTIRHDLIEYHKKLLEKLRNEADKDESISRRFLELRKAGHFYKDDDAMFFYDGGGYTSMQFVEDLVFSAGKILYIGKIYDAHY